jgi:hypothetical protein
MELAELIAWILFALIFAFLGMVLGATWKQVQEEAREAGVITGRAPTRDAPPARQRAQAARRRPRRRA